MFFICLIYFLINQLLSRLISRKLQNFIAMEFYTNSNQYYLFINFIYNAIIINFNHFSNFIHFKFEITNFYLSINLKFFLIHYIFL